MNRPTTRAQIARSRAGCKLIFAVYSQEAVYCRRVRLSNLNDLRDLPSLCSVLRVAERYFVRSGSYAIDSLICQDTNKVLTSNRKLARRIGAEYVSAAALQRQFLDVVGENDESVCSDLDDLIRIYEDIARNAGEVTYRRLDSTGDAPSTLDRTYTTLGLPIPTSHDRHLLRLLYERTVLDERRDLSEIPATVSLVEVADELGLPAVDWARAEISAALERLKSVQIRERIESKEGVSNRQRDVISDMKVVYSLVGETDAVEGHIQFTWQPREHFLTEYDG